MLGIGIGLFNQTAASSGGGTTAAAMTTTNGVNKNSNLTVSGGGNLTVTGVSGTGAFWGDAANVTKTGKRWAAFTLVTYGGGSNGVWIGIDAGGTNFNSSANAPGRDTTGASVRLWPTGAVHTYYLDAVTGDQAGGEDYAVGDEIMLERDDTTGVFKVYKTRSGTSTLIGTGIASGVSNTYTRLFVGIENAASVTVNLGGTTPARTPTAGFSSWQT